MISIALGVLIGSACVLHLSRAETTHLSIFTSHPQMVYRSEDVLPKGKFCVTTNPDYQSDWELFYSDCHNQELRVITTKVEEPNMTSSYRSYFFHFEERSFVNITATGVSVLYKRESEVATAIDKFNDTHCHGLAGATSGFINITEEPLKIFEQGGYYYICFDNNYKSPSFEMTITEFYYDIPEGERKSCDDKKLNENEKCCYSPEVSKPCVYFSPGNSTSKDPVTHLTPMQFYISYRGWVIAIFAMLVVVAVLTVPVAAGCMCCQCKKWRQQQKQRPLS